ncbi:MAG: putative glycoside hydrolase [Patescibacteria group bacterium]
MKQQIAIWLCLAILLLGTCSQAQILTSNYAISLNAVEHRDQLAKHDLLIITAQDLINYHPQWFDQIRQQNPDIIILAHISSMEIPLSHAYEGQAWYTLLQGFQEEWWLQDPSGQQVEFWPGVPMINLSSQCPEVQGETWATYLADYTVELLNQGFLDGVMFDNIFVEVSSIKEGYFDSNHDGQLDDPFQLNDWWRQGQQQLIKSIRKRCPEAIIIVNGDLEGKVINGKHIENFPQYGSRGWLEQLKQLDQTSRRSPTVNVINSAGIEEDQAAMRFGLCSALMVDGVYFSYDQGAKWHGDTWWYPEYGLRLGKPLGDYQVQRSWSETVYEMTSNYGFLVQGHDPDTAWTTVWQGDRTLLPNTSYYVTIEYQVIQKPQRLALRLHDGWTWIVRSFNTEAGQTDKIELDLVTDALPNKHWLPTIDFQGRGEIRLIHIKVERRHHLLSRHFENGLVLVNDFLSPITISLEEPYATMKQDEASDQVTLAGHDGIILLKLRHSWLTVN